MPNLFSDLPVEILAWVRASTSGLTRTAMRRLRPCRRRSGESASSSGSDSTLKQRMSCVDRERHLARGLADAGENDLLRRHARRARAQQLALRDDVDARAEPRQRRQHGLIGIGLHRVADQRIDVGEGAGKTPGSAARSSRSNSNRTACRPRPRARSDRRPRRASRRRDSRNGAWGMCLEHRAGKRAWRALICCRGQNECSGAIAEREGRAGTTSSGRPERPDCRTCRSRFSARFAAPSGQSAPGSAGRTKARREASPGGAVPAQSPAAGAAVPLRPQAASVSAGGTQRGKCQRQHSSDLKDQKTRSPRSLLDVQDSRSHRGGEILARTPCHRVYYPAGRN